jgi:hypothetical protein
VIAFATDVPETNAAMLLSILSHGAIALPLLSYIRGPELLHYHIATARPDLVLTSARFAPACSRIAASLGCNVAMISDGTLDHNAHSLHVDGLKDNFVSDHPRALFRFTRGRSSGRGRGVVWTHADLEGQMIGLDALLGWTANDVVCCGAGDSIQSVMLLQLYALHVGCTFVYYQPSMVDSHRVGQDVRPSVLIGDRAFLFSLLDKHPPLNLSALRNALYMDDLGVPITPHLQERWSAYFSNKPPVELFDLFHTAETGIVDIRPYVSSFSAGELRIPVDTGLRYFDPGSSSFTNVACSSDGLFHAGDRFSNGILHSSPLHSALADCGVVREFIETNCSGERACAVAIRRDVNGSGDPHAMVLSVASQLPPQDRPSMWSFCDQHLLRDPTTGAPSSEIMRNFRVVSYR